MVHSITHLTGQDWDRTWLCQAAMWLNYQSFEFLLLFSHTTLTFMAVLFSELVITYGTENVCHICNTHLELQNKLMYGWNFPSQTISTLRLPNLNTQPTAEYLQWQCHGVTCCSFVSRSPLQTRPSPCFYRFGLRRGVPPCSSTSLCSALCKASLLLRMTLSMCLSPSGCRLCLAYRFRLESQR